jgi:hypothetical protein
MYRVLDELSIRIDGIQQLRSVLGQTRDELERHRKRMNRYQQAAHTRTTIVRREYAIEGIEGTRTIQSSHFRIAGLNRKVL